MLLFLVGVSSRGMRVVIRVARKAIKLGPPAGGFADSLILELVAVVFPGGGVERRRELCGFRGWW